MSLLSLTTRKVRINFLGLFLTAVLSAFFGGGGETSPGANNQTGIKIAGLHFQLPSAYFFLPLIHKAVFSLHTVDLFLNNFFCLARSKFSWFPSQSFIHCLPPVGPGPLNYDPDDYLMKGKYSARDGFTERSDQRSAKPPGEKNSQIAD